jgi:hypothetical protein
MPPDDARKHHLAIDPRLPQNVDDYKGGLFW